MSWPRTLVAGGLALAGALLPAGDVRAQIVVDGSLGTPRTLRGPNFNIDSGQGRTVGNNLFYSFSLFNVLTGERATFIGPGSIANVISRVTGGQMSTIDGVIDTRSFMPGANFFLLNPNGVMLGPNASLNVGGAFHVSTADYLCLGSAGCLTNSAAGKFFASLGRESVLTAAPPAAFGFLGQPTGSITVQGSRLPGNSDPSFGQTISLVGGDINITGATLSPPGGRVQLVSVASAGEVLIPGLDVTSFSRLGPVTVSGSTLDVSGDQGGTVIIRGGQVLIDATAITANTGDADGTPVGIDLASTGGLTISNGSLLTTTTSGAGRGGDIRLAATDLELTSGAAVGTVAAGSGRGGDIQATAGSVLLDAGQVASVALADGAGGAISIAGGRITVTNGGLVNSLNGSATGARGGDISLTATDSLMISHTGSVQSETDFTGDGGRVFVSAPSLTLDSGASIASTTLFDVGHGGDISVETARLTLQGGAGISATTSGPGSGGSITVTATDSALLTDTGTAIATASFGDGLPGDIGARVGTFTLTGGAVIQSGVFAGNQGGNVSIEATGRIVISNGSGISSQAFFNDVGRIAVSAPEIAIDNGYISTGTLQSGRAGDISIDTGTLSLTNGAQIASSSIFLATGNGGNISITARDSVTISGTSPTGESVLPLPFRGFINDASSGLFSTASSANPLAGGGGSISVSTPRLSLTDAGKISVATLGAGAAGDIVIDAGTVTLAGGARIDSSTSGTGRGGILTVTAADSVTISGISPADASVPDTGLFSTASSADAGAGSAGSISVSAPRLSLTDGGSISVATTGVGAAGDIRIDTGTMTVAGGARIDSSTSGTGRGGSLGITASNSLAINGADSGLFSTASSPDAGAGSAGSISVSTPGLALGDGGRISVATTGPGAAGDIRIDTGTMTVAGGARIDSSTSGTGRGGSIGITAGNSLTIAGAGSGLFSTASSPDPLAGSAGSIGVSTRSLALRAGGDVSVATTGPGAAGDIRIDAGTMTVAGGARIDSSTSGSGHGGVITIDTSGGLLTIEGAGLFSDASGTGAGGDITVAAREINLLDGATISATSTGTADAVAGSINITFGDSLVMRNSSIATNAAVADGGNVSITGPGSLLYLLDSQITTSVRSGFGGGGNIMLGASGQPLSFIVLNNGGIHADAFGGPGGNINIFGDVLLSSTPIDTTITASSQLSRPGTVNISAVITNLSGVLAELPSGLLNAPALVRASCTARLVEGKASSLVVAGREGVPLEPGGLLPSTLGEPQVTGATSRAGQFVSTELPTLRLSYPDPKCGR